MGFKEAVIKAATALEDDDGNEYEGTGVQGSIQATGGNDEVAGAILEMCACALKLTILLEEMDESEFKYIKTRLGYMHRLFAHIPREPIISKRIGFKPKPKKKK